MSIGGAVTGGTNLSVLFINPAGTLAQDNPHFTFDPVTNYLNVGVSGDLGRYYLNGLPGLYIIPNASGNNWFEGNAGNASVTGAGNFGTGDRVLANLTSGSGNMGLGGIALGSGGVTTLGAITSGDNNVGIGSSALASCTTGTSNFACGTMALLSSISDQNNVAVGPNAAANLGYAGGGGNNNVALGTSALGAAKSSDGSIAIGAQAASNYSSSTGNVCIGQYSGSGSSGATIGNTLIGAQAGKSLTGNYGGNTVLGQWSGPFATIYYAIVLAGGADHYCPALDCNYTYTTTGCTWSFTTRPDTYPNPAAIHVYNTMDASPPTNYERACFDWNLTSNVFRIASQNGGTGTVRLIAIDAFSKAGAPAAGDLPAGTCAFIDDTTNNQTWLVFNKAGTIRKVQLT
jgi:hypothetical protein